MKSRMIAAALMLAAPLAAMLPVPASAQAPAAAERGLAKGAKIPAISVTTDDGAPATFETLKGERGLVLAFVRSADWCPFCKKQLADLNGVAGELKSAGYPLVALSYDSVEKLKAFSEATKLSYTLVSDPQSKAIDAFGVRNLEVANNARFNGIPHPVIFIIGGDGVVQAKLYEESYQKRPAPQLVVEAVKAQK